MSHERLKRDKGIALGHYIRAARHRAVIAMEINRAIKGLGGGRPRYVRDGGVRSWWGGGYVEWIKLGTGQ